MEKKDIIPFIEPIFRFSYSRLNNRYDAEDLASEILCHVLDGMGKYSVQSPEAWVWRVAHNRYARFIEERNRRKAILSDKELFEVEDDYCQVDEASVEEEYEKVFRSLHTLSSSYRDIFVDYYIGEMSVRQLSEKYSLSENTVKWRLNVGRSRIRERIGVEEMDKVYQRIDWETNCCNGSMDSDKYLHTQVARAICQAAYEKPLTVEEISLCTGIPAMYIEDELPRLEYGDAISRTGNKYATDFIIFRRQDRRAAETVLAPMVKALADYYEETLWDPGKDFRQIGFYGCDFGMERLGHILIPYFIRKKIQELKNHRLNLPDGEYPPRKDGGFGWFIVEEKQEGFVHDSGCNVAGDDSGSSFRESDGFIYYYWVAQYFDNTIYHNGGTRWLCAHGIPQSSKDGVVPEGMLDEEDVVRLLGKNLIRKEGNGYRLQFACFTKEQFTDFCGMFDGDDSRLDDLLAGLILAARKSFEGFVPKRLYGQINQWLFCYCCEIISHVTEELVARGRLRGAEKDASGLDRPMVNGVFYVKEYINP